MSNDDDEGMVDLSKKKVLGLNDYLNFGKYKGRLIKSVLKQDPGYLCWAQDTVQFFDLDDDVLLKATEAAEARQAARHSSNHSRQDQDQDQDTYDRFKTPTRGRFGDTTDDPNDDIPF